MDTGVAVEECLHWETVTARDGHLSQGRAGDGRVVE